MAALTSETGGGVSHIGWVITSSERHLQNPETGELEEVRPPRKVPGVRFFTGGRTSMVGLFEDEPDKVLKCPHRPQPGIKDDNAFCIQLEHDIFEHLGPHPQIAEYLGRNEHGLIFRRAINGDVRHYLAKCKEEGKTVASEQRLRWVMHAAEAVSFIHSKDIIHCDLHTFNLLLDQSLNVKLCDFAGSIFGDRDGMAMEAARYCLPRTGTEATQISDRFALGSMIFEIMTDAAPYENLRDADVEELFKNQEFPSVNHLSVGSVIQKCWMQSYENTLQVLQDLRAAST